MIKYCIICNIKFITKRINKLSCSPECAAKRKDNYFVPKEMMNKNCVVCNEKFKSNRKKDKLCTKKECKLKWISLTRKSRKLPSQTKICVICNNKYERMGKGNPITCSKECSIKNERLSCKKWINKNIISVKINRKNFWQKIKPDPIIKNCIICIKEYKSLRGNQITCSPECSEKNRLNYESKRRPFIKITCKICKIIFETKQSNSKCCSKKCLKENRNIESGKWHKAHPEVGLKSGIKHLTKYGLEFKLPAYQYQWAINSWSKTVRKLVGEYCSICGSDVGLNSHHIFPKATHPKLSLNINNGIPLCKEHHDEVHRLNPIRRQIIVA
jgi:hypothetical protein